jgi:ribokinase
MPHVIVLGSSGFDLTVRLPRLPQRGETLLGGQLHTGPGGKGANQAIAARRAGAEVTFLTAFGDDDFGRRIFAHDQNEGLNLDFAQTITGQANQVALIFVGDDAENLIGVAPGASALLTPQMIDAVPEQVFAPGTVLLASLEVPLPTVARGLKRAKGAGLVTVLNPAPADRGLLGGGMLKLVDVLTPNQEEARALTDLPTGTMEQAMKAAQALLTQGAGSVVLTLGGDGCLVVTDREVQHVPACRVEVVDTVGAGDAFNGALAVALAEGPPLVQAAARACAAGALAVTKPGAQGALPTREEIDRLLASSIR